MGLHTWILPCAPSQPLHWAPAALISDLELGVNGSTPPVWLVSGSLIMRHSWLGCQRLLHPSLGRVPGNKLLFGPLEQHCISPSAHLGISCIPDGVEAGPPASVSQKLLVSQGALCILPGAGGWRSLLSPGVRGSVLSLCFT